MSLQLYCFVYTFRNTDSENPAQLLFGIFRTGNTVISRNNGIHLFFIPVVQGKGCSRPEKPGLYQFLYSKLSVTLFYEGIEWSAPIDNLSAVATEKGFQWTLLPFPKSGTSKISLTVSDEDESTEFIITVGE